MIWVIELDFRGPGIKRIAKRAKQKGVSNDIIKNNCVPDTKQEAQYALTEGH